MGTEVLTLAQVMKKYKKSYTQVRYATEQNLLKGQKVGWIWIYSAEDLPEEWPKKEKETGGTS